MLSSGASSGSHRQSFAEVADDDDEPEESEESEDSEKKPENRLLMHPSGLQSGRAPRSKTPEERVSMSEITGTPKEGAIVPKPIKVSEGGGSPDAQSMGGLFYFFCLVVVFSSLFQQEVSLM